MSIPNLIISVTFFMILAPKTQFSPVFSQKKSPKGELSPSGTLFSGIQAANHRAPQSNRRKDF